MIIPAHVLRYFNALRKPWNHLHRCTVVLWTKLVVGFMFLERIVAIKKREKAGKQNAMRVPLIVSGG